MTIYTVYICFFIFVIFLFMISFYFILSLIHERVNKERIKNKKNEILKLLENTLEKEHPSSDEVQKLEKSFSNKVGIQAFYLAYKEYVEKNKYSEELKNLMNKVVDYKKILKSRIVREEYKESYALYLISAFKINTKEVMKFELKALDHKSIYVRNNALNAIKSNKEIEMILEALNQINEKKYYFNEKILIDFIDNFEGDIKKLDDKLLLEFENYNLMLKKIIIEHFTNMKNDHLDIRDKMIDFISNSKEKELIIMSTKYFAEIIDKRAGTYILRNMDSEDWTIRAISAKVISNYENEGIIDKLKERIRDENYFVRYNSAYSFLKMEKKENVLKEAINNEDLFAKDILLYCMNTEGIISLDRYRQLIEETDIEEKTEVKTGEAVSTV